MTELANTRGVSLAETMASARHSSVSASLSYQRRDSNSEVAKFNAIAKLHGVNPDEIEESEYDEDEIPDWLAQEFDEEVADS